MTPKSVTSKPSRGRPKKSVTTYSLCKTVGHTKTTCPQRKVLSDEAVLASLSSPIESIEPPHILHSSSVSSNTKSCLFCCSPVSEFNVSGRPLLVCDSCTPIDPCRILFAIPQFVSPAHSSSLATVIRSLTFSLRKGIWNPSIFWKFILSKAMSSHKKSKYKRSVQQSKNVKKRFESLILRSQYSSALKLLAGSSPAALNDETLDSLNSLHPPEDFTINHIVSDNERDFFTANPITCDEVSVAIKGLPSGRSAGPSGLSYDHLKSAVNICPEIVDDLAFFFNSVIMGRFKLPQAVTTSRLVALSKPGGGVRPIAVGESIMRLLAIISFKRVKSSAINFFRPYQFAIGIPDGTTCAALCTNLLFNQKGENYLLNIDFKNAFKLVFRSSILQKLELHYPPILPYFKLMYGSPSNLIFHSENIVSSRSVKQGDPLGPFFFCLALQSVLVKFKSDFPDIHICAYADDLSLIGPLSLLQHGLQHFVFLSKQIGLDIKLPKCFIIGNQNAEVAFNETFINYVDYKEDNQLFSILEKIEEQLLAIQDLEIDKHLAFSVLNVCFGSKINHLLRSLSPTISHDFARQFNGGMKNFLFEWKLRFDHIPLNESHPLLISLENMVQELPVDVWNRSFPSSLPAVPSRSFTNLHLAVVKLQKSVLIGFEDLDFSKRLSVTKINNPVFLCCLFIRHSELH
ncbi:hypothetical protein P9112_007195 [Eukaryota sp. TZLM1-RC]